MPIYEYECLSCGKIIEVIEKYGSNGNKVCTCGSSLKKIISKSNFHLKGSGWYVTDYKDKSSGGENVRNKKV